MNFCGFFLFAVLEILKLPIYFCPPSFGSEFAFQRITCGKIFKSKKIFLQFDRALNKEQIRQLKLFAISIYYSDIR